MPRVKSEFICQQCGYKSPSFLGRCPSCDTWGSLVETIEESTSVSWGKGKNVTRTPRLSKITPLSNIRTRVLKRVSTGISEVDQVLGKETELGKNGGFVPGSLVLLAGDPGIGKSTLTLQILSHIGGLYVSGEESVDQLKLRAERLKVKTDKISILSETNIEAILSSAEEIKNEINLLIVDSIQTIWSQDLTGVPGSIGQVRECTLKLLDFAKKTNIPVLLIGHVTKEGTIAGPKILEHIVDTVLYLEGDRFQILRLLRTQKNRFGPIDEVGVFSMEDKGMREVANPSEIFLGDGKKGAGSVVIVTLEGSRPMLVEVQALTVPSYIPVPKRVGNGINNNRLQMLVAILQKHLNMPLYKFDIFINVASGIKVFEPAADLGICLAIISSMKNKTLSSKSAAIGEVGLLGEIRQVIGHERRIKEARRLGFTGIISAKTYNHISRITTDLF